MEVTPSAETIKQQNQIELEQTLTNEPSPITDLEFFLANGRPFTNNALLCKRLTIAGAAILSTEAELTPTESKELVRKFPKEAKALRRKIEEILLFTKSKSITDGKKVAIGTINKAIKNLVDQLTRYKLCSLMLNSLTMSVDNSENGDWKTQKVDYYSRGLNEKASEAILNLLDRYISKSKNDMKLYERSIEDNNNNVNKIDDVNENLSKDEQQQQLDFNQPEIFDRASVASAISNMTGFESDQADPVRQASANFDSSVREERILFMKRRVKERQKYKIVFNPNTNKPSRTKIKDDSSNDPLDLTKDDEMVLRLYTVILMRKTFRKLFKGTTKKWASTPVIMLMRLYMVAKMGLSLDGIVNAVLKTPVENESVEGDYVDGISNVNEDDDTDDDDDDQRGNLQTPKKGKDEIYSTPTKRTPIKSLTVEELVNSPNSPIKSFSNKNNDDDNNNNDVFSVETNIDNDLRLEGVSDKNQATVDKLFFMNFNGIFDKLLRETDSISTEAKIKFSVLAEDFQIKLKKSILEEKQKELDKKQ